MGPGGSYYTGGTPESDPSKLSCCYWQGGGFVTLLWQSDVAGSAVKDGEPPVMEAAGTSSPFREPGCSVAYAMCSLDGKNCLGVPGSTPGVPYNDPYGPPW